MTTPLISFANVCRTYTVGSLSIPAVQGVSFDIREREFVAITGPSGSGKSTLLHMIGLLDTPSSGIFAFNGSNASTLSEREKTRLRLEHISFVFQFFNLIENYTATENIAFQLELQGVPRGEATQKALEVIQFLGLGHRAHLFPNELSGGEQQRVAIGRAVAKNSKIILADEPTAHLDSSNAEKIIQLLRNVNQTYGRTVILVTHEPSEASQASRTITLRDGKIITDSGVPKFPRDL